MAENLQESGPGFFYLFPNIFVIFVDRQNTNRMAIGTGIITQVVGPVVDVHFDQGDLELPPGALIETML